MISRGLRRRQRLRPVTDVFIRPCVVRSQRGLRQRSASTQGANPTFLLKTDAVRHERTSNMVGFQTPAITSRWTTFPTSYFNYAIQIQDGVFSSAKWCQF